MMRGLALLLLSCFCGLGHAAGQPLSPSFQIDVVQNCELVVPAACNEGIERFTISGEGTWRAALRNAGPARQGDLDRAQLSELQSAVRQLASAGAAPPDLCKPRPLPPQTLETISVELPGSTIMLYGSGGKIDPRCGGPGSPTDRLFSAADSSMRKALAAPQ
jgi:hypothetical protein